jgi:hypothetical protein
MVELSQIEEKSAKEEDKKDREREKMGNKNQKE